MQTHSLSEQAVHTIYQIEVDGHLDPQWGEWFQGLEITWTAKGTTRFYGVVTDQAALFSLLRSIRDLGLPLLSLNRILPQ